MYGVEWRIKGKELIVKTKLSDRPLQIVDINEVTGITLFRDTSMGAFLILFAGISLLSLIYILQFGVIMAFLTFVMAWQYFNRGKSTFIHAKSHTVIVRGHHPEIWEAIKKARRK